MHFDCLPFIAFCFSFCCAFAHVWTWGLLPHCWVTALTSKVPKFALKPSGKAYSKKEWSMCKDMEGFCVPGTCYLCKVYVKFM